MDPMTTAKPLIYVLLIYRPSQEGETRIGCVRASNYHIEDGALIVSREDGGHEVFAAGAWSRITANRADDQAEATAPAENAWQPMEMAPKDSKPVDIWVRSADGSEFRCEDVLWFDYRSDREPAGWYDHEGDSLAKLGWTPVAWMRVRPPTPPKAEPSPGPAS